MSRDFPPLKNARDRKKGIPPSQVSGRQLRTTPPVTDELLDGMVRAIVEEVDPEKVVLFGSRGRGDAGANSDVDLLVIEAESFGPDRPKHSEMRRLSDAVRDYRVPKDILVFSNEEVEYWHDSLNHVLARALREGRVLYERPAGDATEPTGRVASTIPEGTAG